MRNILFIDIETVSQKKDFNSLELREKELFYQKIKHYKDSDEKSPEIIYSEKGGILAEYGKIISIGLGYFKNINGEEHLKTKVLYDENEKKLLEQLLIILTKFKNYKLCAHNGKEFDYPFICRRLLINRISLPNMLQLSGKKSWEVKHIDTLELWKFGDYKHYTSLDTLCMVFGIPSPKNNIDGSKINHYYYEKNNLELIANYCERDIIALARVYQCLIGEEFIQDEKIITNKITELQLDLQEI